MIGPVELMLCCFYPLLGSRSSPSGGCFRYEDALDKQAVDGPALFTISDCRRVYISAWPSQGRGYSQKRLCGRLLFPSPTCRYVQSNVDHHGGGNGGLPTVTNQPLERLFLGEADLSA